VTGSLATGAASDRLETLDLFHELLAQVDVDTETCNFYTKVCEGIASLTPVERVVLFLYDEPREMLRAAGATGLALLPLHGIEIALSELPIARRALEEGAVVEAVGDLRGEVAPVLVSEFGVSALACMPLVTADRWLGVIAADRGAACGPMPAAEREVLWTAGKVAALAASARHVTREEERARRLREHIGVAREVHERVIQRLFAVSCALGAGELAREDRDFCREEMQAAVRELRETLERPVAGTGIERPLPDLRQELKRLSVAPGGAALKVLWPDGVNIPRGREALVRHFVAEAVRNVHKHARASQVSVTADAASGAFAIAVVNDGVGAAPRSAGGVESGLGLRLLEADAGACGATVASHAQGPERWVARLCVPFAPEER
jgi:signal transduction histidine kinase